eukprot:3369720-Rhodomonas_salina.1
MERTALFKVNYGATHGINSLFDMCRRAEFMMTMEEDWVGAAICLRSAYALSGTELGSSTLKKVSLVPRVVIRGFRTERECMLWAGMERAYDLVPCSGYGPASPGTVLPACYDMPAPDRTCCPKSTLRHARYLQSMLLRACYAMPGTDVRYAAARRTTLFWLGSSFGA